MAKENCWEFKKCGREHGGVNEEHLGVCPAALQGEGEGVNDSKSRGRICWAVTGTFCGGEIQGTFAQKEISCLDCDFFKKVEEEEGCNFCLLIPGQTFHPTKSPRCKNEEES